MPVVALTPPSEMSKYSIVVTFGMLSQKLTRKCAYAALLPQCDS